MYWIIGWFLGIANSEYSPCRVLYSISSFIPWTAWNVSSSEVIFFQAERYWDRHPALKCLMSWYRFLLYRGSNSRNILTLDAYFLNTCVTSCWWHFWRCWMTALNAGGSFCRPGWVFGYTTICVPKRTVRAWLVTNFLKFGNRVVDKSILNSRGFFSFLHAFQQILSKKIFWIWGFLVA